MRIVKDLDIVKGNAVAKTRSQRLDRGFFGGPNAGNALGTLLLAVPKVVPMRFFCGDQTPDECIPAALNRLRDPPRFDDIYTNSHI